MLLSPFTLFAAVLTALCTGVAVGIWAEGRFRRRTAAADAEAAAGRTLPVIAPDDPKVLEQYVKEWQVVVETQRHFHDLVMRFRQGTLTTFVATTGAAITLARFTSMGGAGLTRLLLLPVVYWLAAGALDLFYYQRLLAGAGAQSEKFDRAPWFAERGFFGLTTTLARHVPASASRWLVAAYYALPLVWGLAALFWQPIPTT